jgi:hypothetical protein
MNRQMQPAQVSGMGLATVVVLLALTACSAAPAATSPAPSTPPASASSTAAPTPSAIVTVLSPSPTLQPTVTTSPSAAAVTATPAGTVPPTATPVPTMLAEPSWERVADQQSLAGSRMLAVAAGPNGFVAVGTTDDEEAIGIAWISEDGRTWTRAADELSGGEPSGIIWDGSRYVAFGGGASVLPPAVWTSPDGQHWQPAAGISNAEVTFLFVARLGDKLVAIGGSWGDSEGPTTDTLKTWTSSDGLAWQPVAAEASPLAFGGLGGITAANGMLVAWGWIYSDSERQFVTLRSTDGLTWKSSMVGEPDDSIGEIIGSEDGFVAVGSGPFCCEAGATAPVKAWTSADATAWTPADFKPEPGSDQLERVVRYGGRYVSLGTSAGAPISWVSLDGAVWTENASVPDSAEDGDPCTGGPCPVTSVGGLAGGGPGLVAVGARRILDEETGGTLGWRSVVWIAPAVEN